MSSVLVFILMYPAYFTRSVNKASGCWDVGGGVVEMFVCPFILRCVRLSVVHVPGRGAEKSGRSVSEWQFLEFQHRGTMRGRGV